MKTKVLVSLLLLQLLQIPGLYAELRTSSTLIECLNEMGFTDVVKRIENCKEELPTCTISVTISEIKTVTTCGKIIGQINQIE